MPTFSKNQARWLSGCVTNFTESFQRSVADVIRTQFRGCQPQEVSVLLEELHLLVQQLGVRQNPVRVHDAFNGLIKRIVMDERRRVAEAIDGPMQKAADPQLVKHLTRELGPLEGLMEAPWFEECAAVRLPALTDYLSIRYAEDSVPEPLALAPREYDEKFHILEAPSLFLSDLAYYRRKCAFREAPITVAFADIDDFKAINTRYTETVVDMKLLAPFMEIIEAHTFVHGHAYRFGGDEYVLLLPNMPEDWALEFLRGLQRRVSTAEFLGIRAKVSISIGACTIGTDCWLTDREVLAKANVAKNHVKATDKGKIGTYAGSHYRDEDLVVK